MKRLALLLCLLSAASCAQDMDRVRTDIRRLCAPEMAGRGYVSDGGRKAAEYLEEQYRKSGLHPFDSGFLQAYRFPVNRFPGAMRLTTRRRRLRPDVDFLTEAASAPFHGSRRIVRINLSRIRDTNDFRQKLQQSDTRRYAYVLDSVPRALADWHVSRKALLEMLPRGLFLLPDSRKFTWTVSQSQMQATVCAVRDSLLGRRIKGRIDAEEYEHTAYNLAGYIPGTRDPDSFLAISAHYDHLGEMGRGVLFPGASDNASGTALVLELMRYYSYHPQPYSIAFFHFSGEEAGLLGSRYFTSQPLLSLSRIRFLLNLDIMGNAEEGITCVNATEFPGPFRVLTALNNARLQLPQVKSRGKAANSDHYPFYERGVPCFFWYSNGGPGYYHDIYDRPETLTLQYIDGVYRLALDFFSSLQH